MKIIRNVWDFIFELGFELSGYAMMFFVLMVLPIVAIVGVCVGIEFGFQRIADATFPDCTVTKYLDGTPVQTWDTEGLILTDGPSVRFRDKETGKKIYLSGELKVERK